MTPIIAIATGIARDIEEKHPTLKTTYYPGPHYQTAPTIDICHTTTTKGQLVRLLTITFNTNGLTIETTTEINEPNPSPFTTIIKTKTHHYEDPNLIDTIHTAIEKTKQQTTEYPWPTSKTSYSP